MYRQSLSVEEQAMLPTNPAGEIELADAELEAIFGADGGYNAGGDTSNQATASTSSDIGGILNHNGFNIPDAAVNVLSILVQRVPVTGLLGTSGGDTQAPTSGFVPGPAGPPQGPASGSLGII